MLQLTHVRASNETSDSMIPKPPTMIVPLQADEHGVIRVSGTRVTLEVLIMRFQQGVTPEAIHERFDVVPLNDIYAVIAYYLAHRDELDIYLEQRENEAQHLRQKWESQHPPTVTRAELERRLGNRTQGQND